MVLGKTFRVWKKSQPRSVLLECKNNEETLLFESGAIAVLSMCQNIQFCKKKKKIAWICLVSYFVCGCSFPSFFPYVYHAASASEECEHVKKQYSKVIDAHACLGVLNVNLGMYTTCYAGFVLQVSSFNKCCGKVPP